MRVARACCRLAVSAIALLVISSSAVRADYCGSLGAELANLDRAARSPGALGQELRNAQAEAGRAGCDGGFFFFGPPSSRHCSALLGRVDMLQRSLWGAGQGFGWSGYDLQARRAELRRAMARSGCDQNGFWGNYRTLCVRTCDGYYFPIGWA